MGWYIGAKDKVDKAIVKYYANTQTTKFDNEQKIKPDDMWKMINMLSMRQQVFHIKRAFIENSVQLNMNKSLK